MSEKFDKIISIFESYSEDKGIHSEVHNADTLKIFIPPDKVSIMDKMNLERLGCKPKANHFEVTI